MLLTPFLYTQPMSKLSQYLHKSTLYLFYFLFLSVPLTWYSQTSELFEFPKMILTYSLTILILATWTARIIVQKKLIFRRTSFDPFLLAFFFSQVISTIISIHPRTSFLGYYSRFHGGLLSTITYIILFYAFVSNFNKKQTKTALLTLLVSGFLSSLYALPEHFGYAFSCLSVRGTSDSLGNFALFQNMRVDCWIQDIQNRIFGTFGQPNWLAAYLITLIPTSIALSIHTLTQKTYSLTKAAFFSITSFLMLLILIYTNSRSGFLGLAISLATFFSLYVLVKTKFSLPKIKNLFSSHRKALLFAIVPLAILTVFTGTPFTPSANQFINRQTNPTPPQSTPTGTLLESGDLSIPILQNAGTQSSKIREIVWKGAIDVFKHYPLFGSGVETFAYSYYNYRPMEHNLVSEWDFIYNKAHNEFLNFAANSGIVGIATYTAIIIYFFYFVLRQTFKHKKNDLSLLVLIALFSGYLALTISNFFGFSTVAVGILFFIFPAISITLTQQLPSQLKNQTVQPQISTYQFVGLSSVLFVTCYLSFLTFNYFRADLLYAEAIAFEGQNAFTEAEKRFQKAIQLSHGEPLYHNHYADSLGKAAYVYATQENIIQSTKLAELAFRQSSTTLKKNPVQLNYYKTQAGVFIRLSQVDPNLLTVAKTILEDAQSLAPTDAKITYNRALVELDIGNEDKSIQLLEEATQMKANYEAAHLQLAQMYQQRDQLDQAIEHYQYILNYIAPGNTQAREALDQLAPSE